MNRSTAMLLARFLLRFYDLFEGWLEKNEIAPEEGGVIISELERIENEGDSQCCTKRS